MCGLDVCFLKMLQKLRDNADGLKMLRNSVAPMKMLMLMLDAPRGFYELYVEMRNCKCKIVNASWMRWKMLENADENDSLCSLAERRVIRNAAENRGVIVEVMFVRRQ
jgi:hypothetical protein